MEQLTPHQRAKIRRAAAPKEPAPGEEAGELNVVPFLDIVTNVMMFVLAGLTVGFTTTVDVTPPRGGPGLREKAEHLDLAVLIAEDGYWLKARGGSIAQGCDRVGGGSVTVPRIAGSASADGRVYDAAGLARCARRLKREVPGAESERQVLLTANPNVPMQEIVRAMDALRSDPEGDLFPDVVLTVVK